MGYRVCGIGVSDEGIVVQGKDYAYRVYAKRVWTMCNTRTGYTLNAYGAYAMPYGL